MHDVDDYRAIVERSLPLLDVRAPSEYARGALPGAVNLPLLYDEEREAVGKAHKKDGRDAAVALGHRLVAGEVKRSRLAAWRRFAGERPQALICCWRGGLRSRIVQQWLAAEGVALPRVIGGFKALRRFCMDVVEHSGERALILIGGRTGSGKTALLKRLGAHIDLEALANHRGSAFGAMGTPQPAPATFENALAAELLRADPDAPLALEDEGRSIGRLAIPAPLFEAMQRAPIALVEVATAERIDNIYREYVQQAGDGLARLPEALAKIQRRLGGARYQRMAAQMQAALDAGPEARELHRAWIGELLRDYYDPMYDYQLAAKQSRVVMRGSPAQVADFIRASGTVANAAGRDAGPPAAAPSQA